jgi:hypothetical protein
MEEHSKGNVQIWSATIVITLDTWQTIVGNFIQKLNLDLLRSNEDIRGDHQIINQIWQIIPLKTSLQSYCLDIGLY